MGNTVEDVDLVRLLEDVKYVTRQTTINRQLKGRIISALYSFEGFMKCNKKIALQMTRDLTAIRELTRKGSEDLERKFNTFDRKLRKLINAVSSEAEIEKHVSSKCYHMLTTLFQDNDIRIIDKISRVSTLSILEECIEMLYLTKKVIRMTEATDIPLSLKNNTLTDLSCIIHFLKIDGVLALKLKKDVLHIRTALKSKTDGQADLQNRLKILKLKIQRCISEIDRKQNYIKKLKVELDENTKRAIAYIEKRIGGGKKKRHKRRNLGDLQDEYKQGTEASRTVPEQVQSPTSQVLPRVANGWLLMPIDPTSELPFSSPPLGPIRFGVQCTTKVKAYA